MYIKPIVTLLLSLSVGAALANPRMETNDKKWEPLTFASTPTEPGFFTNIRNNIFLPVNPVPGPKPAVIILHSCSGLHKDSYQTTVEWTDFLRESGFVVMVIDHMGSRGVERNCGARRPISGATLGNDVYEAISHLSKLPDVDKNRIFTVGFSLGAMTNGLLASNEFHSKFGQGRLRPRAVAGLYGGCEYKHDSWLFKDTNLPMLWLMGGSDNDGKPERCMPTIESVNSKQKLIQWHTYPEQTHCWDCRELHNLTKKLGNGEWTTYRYNEEVTKDSKKRVVDFFKSFN